MFVLMVKYIEPRHYEKEVIETLFHEYSHEDPFDLHRSMDITMLYNLACDKCLFTSKSIDTYMGYDRCDYKGVLKDGWSDFSKCIQERISGIECNQEMVNIFNEMSNRISNNAYTGKCVWLSFTLIDQASRELYVNSHVERLTDGMHI